ncbi:MAG: aryl-sulfate sulfotransferase [Clostridiales bacterium]|nr:aryl-sulfate sulfotransferase [Clostridiales bacterium]
MKEKFCTVWSKSLAAAAVLVLAAGLMICAARINAEAAETELTTEAVEDTEAAADTILLTETDIFAAQSAIDAALLQEAAAGYSFESPLVVLDPYGNSPLTAVAIFSTDEELGGTITVKGKSEENDISGTFDAATNHIVPIYGLYNGDTTEVVLTLDDGTSVTLEVTTEEIDTSAWDIEAEMLDSEAYDYSTMTLTMQSGGVLLIIDSAGDIRWYFNSLGTQGVHQLSNGHLMAPASYTISGTYYKSGLVEFDLSGKYYREYAIPGGEHHDFQELSNGNLLVASNSPDLSSIEDYIVEIDRETGEVVWELDMRDILGDTDDGASASILTDGAEDNDWLHNNSLWYDEENDLLLVSARHKDAIIAVHKTEKTLAWILGDPDGWESIDESYFFTPVGDDFEWFYAEHQVTMLDNGDIMLFDNGTAKVKYDDNDNRVTGNDVYSRAVIYRIDTEAMTVEQIFEYGKERGAEWYSDWISGVISLDGTQDALQVTAGSNLYSAEEDSYDYGPIYQLASGYTSTTHIDRLIDGELVFELTITGDTYRSQTYRSLVLSVYTEGATLDVTQTGVLLGSLGEKATVEPEADISLEDAETLPDGWTFSRDATKVTLSGSFTTKTSADDLADGYLVLKSADETKVYTLTQSTTESDGTTTVAVKGWVSPDGLEGSTWEIFLMLDGVTYASGYSVDF